MTNFIPKENVEWAKQKKYNRESFMHSFYGWKEYDDLEIIMKKYVFIDERL